MYFEVVDTFRYLGTNINNENDIGKEIPKSDF